MSHVRETRAAAEKFLSSIGEPVPPKSVAEQAAEALESYERGMAEAASEWSDGRLLDGDRERFTTMLEMARLYARAFDLYTSVPE